MISRMVEWYWYSRDAYRRSLTRQTMEAMMRRPLSMLGILLPLLLVSVWASISPKAGEGAVTVSPDSGVAGNFGTWTVTYRAGERGIAEGGGMRVELPDSWHAGDRNSANPLQATNPRGDYYVSARSSREDVELQTIVEGESKELLVKAARPSLDGRSERYVFVARVRVARGRLHRGDTLSVIYGDTSRGSRGMRAAVIATAPEPILVAVDATGSGTFVLHPDRPAILSKSGPPALGSGTTTSTSGAVPARSWHRETRVACRICGRYWRRARP